MGAMLRTDGPAFNALGAPSRPFSCKQVCRPAPCLALGHAAHQVERLVGRRAGEVHETVAHCEEGGDGADVPDGLVVEAVFAQRGEIPVLDPATARGELDGEVEHGALARVISALR